MRTIILLFAVLCTMASCTSKSNETAETSSLDHYMAIKNALVATDFELTKSAASSFLNEDMPSQLKSSVQAIVNGNDVAAQRMAFETLSKEMYQMITTNGATENVLYKQYCPMAFNNKGAFWLSTEKEIMNPYFGDMMLHCGSIDETISQ